MFRKKVNLTAHQHWKLPQKVFPNNGGKDGFRGFRGFAFNLFYLILLFKTVSKILLLIYYNI